MTYKLKVPDDITEVVRGMHPHLKRKVKASLKLILEDPGEGKELKNEFAGLRSFRIGRFRIIYRAKRKIIEIVAIGPRDRIYEETYLILKKEKR